MKQSDHTGKSFSSVSTGAAFLMATSAIGPGFLTQTTVFTQQLMASTGFVILCSVLIDIIAQLNIWTIIASGKQPAPRLANMALPGSGQLLTLLIATGGLAFNIGNIAGCGMGLHMLLPVTVETGGMISALLAILLFLMKDANKAMDAFVKLLGIVMITLMCYVALVSRPPIAETAVRSLLPSTINFTAIVTLVGGTVGGYITFAGAHRLLEATPIPSMNVVRKSAARGILLTACMRALLFLAVLGVLHTGATLDPANPAASVFRAAAGSTGYYLFGVVLWSAAITSVVGSAFTSVSFLRTLHPLFERKRQLTTILFILSSALIFFIAGKPVTILIVAGALNGFILPFALALMLWIAGKKMIPGYQHPRWLSWLGWLTVALMLWMSIMTFAAELPKLL